MKWVKVINTIPLKSHNAPRVNKGGVCMAFFSSPGIRFYNFLGFFLKRKIFFKTLFFHKVLVLMVNNSLFSIKRSISILLGHKKAQCWQGQVFANKIHFFIYTLKNKITL